MKTKTEDIDDFCDKWRIKLHHLWIANNLTLTKASRTSRPCSTLRGVETLSPLVIRVRVVRHVITSWGFTCKKRPSEITDSWPVLAWPENMFFFKANTSAPLTGFLLQWLLSLWLVIHFAKIILNQLAELVDFYFSKKKMVPHGHIPGWYKIHRAYTVKESFNYLYTNWPPNWS